MRATGRVRWPGRLGCLLLGLTLAQAMPRPAAAQEGIFDRANQLYQEGDWEGAIEAYQSILEGGLESADLHYNLGNAHFKNGSLGEAVLSWERARRAAPGDPDVEANLELARSLTADVIEPLPTFWVVSVARWWIDLLPRSILVTLVALGWIAATGGVVAAILGRREDVQRVGRWVAYVGGGIVLVLGLNLAVRELGVGVDERGVILVESVPVRSAPADDDNLTLFEVHEGTAVRLEQRAGPWAEIVLDDGKVGWVPIDAMGVI